MKTTKKDLINEDATEIPKIDTDDYVEQQMDVLPDSQESVCFVASIEKTDAFAEFNTVNFDSVVIFSNSRPYGVHATWTNATVEKLVDPLKKHLQGKKLGQAKRFSSTRMKERSFNLSF